MRGSPHHVLLSEAKSKSRDPAKSADDSATGFLDFARNSTISIEGLALFRYRVLDADRSILCLVRHVGWYVVRAISRPAKNSRRDQIATIHRCSSVGAMVLQLPGRVQNRRVDQNGQ